MLKSVLFTNNYQTLNKENQKNNYIQIDETINTNKYKKLT